jgi:hypothetical protein
LAERGEEAEEEVVADGKFGMHLAINIGLIFVGACLIYWATNLSVLYNGLTTGVRERRPDPNPPPTPDWRRRNTMIMTWMFRVAGVLVILRSILLMIAKA